MSAQTKTIRAVCNTHDWTGVRFEHHVIPATLKGYGLVYEDRGYARRQIIAHGSRTELLDSKAKRAIGKDIRREFERVGLPLNTIRWNLGIGGDGMHDILTIEAPL